MRWACDFPLSFLALCPLSLFFVVYAFVGLYFWEPVRFVTDAAIEGGVTVFGVILYIGFVVAIQNKKTLRLVAKIIPVQSNSRCPIHRRL